MRNWIIILVSLSSSLVADIFEKNQALVDQLAQNNVRVIVLCNFQATNNVMDIVTASRSPLYELTQYGLAVLHDKIPQFETENISRIYSTPAFRAQQAANLIGKALDMAPSQVILDMRLGMQQFGDAEGEDFDVYKARFTSLANMLESMPTNGESGTAVFTRLQDFLKSLTTYENQTILVITHAFNYCHISKCLTGKFGSLPPLGTFRVYDFNSALNLTTH